MAAKDFANFKHPSAFSSSNFEPLSYENSSKACIICSQSTQGYMALFVPDSADKENITRCVLRKQLVPR